MWLAGETLVFGSPMVSGLFFIAAELEPMGANFICPKTFSRKRKISALKTEILKLTTVISKNVAIKSQNTTISLSNA